jgi:hypothetical protein
MSAQCEVTARRAAGAPMSFFERWLSLWVALCIVVGVALGQWFPAPFQALGRLEVAQVNLPVGLLIWVMIIPMLMKIAFGASTPATYALAPSTASPPPAGAGAAWPAACVMPAIASASARRCNVVDVLMDCLPMSMDGPRDARAVR